MGVVIEFLIEDKPRASIEKTDEQLSRGLTFFIRKSLKTPFPFNSNGNNNPIRIITYWEKF